MSRNTVIRSTNLHTAALIAALVACAGQAIGDAAVSGKAMTDQVAATDAERAEVLATFRSGPDDGAPGKFLPEAPVREVRRASWDQPRPEVPADLKAAELPNYYLYMGKPVRMNLDTARLAVKFAGLDAKADSAPLLAALARLGVNARSVEPNNVANWWFVNLGARLGDAGAVNAAIELLLTDPSFEFASPVFEHVTIRGGYYLVTPEVNIRVREADVADADQIVSRVAKGFDLIEGDLGGLAGARQVRATDRNGFRVLRAANEMYFDDRVAWAEPDSVSTMELHFVPNDAFWGAGSMWGWEQNNDIDTDAETAWDLTRGNPAMRVLVMDCGTEQDHPDINQLAGRDFTTGAAAGVAGGGPAGNCDRHGTPVSGIISGRINNSIGGAGVAPNCRTLSAKTATEDTNPCASTYAAFSGSWLANALEWGENQGCRISNSSFGVGSSNTITNAYDDKQANGMIHFASAGNGGADNIGDPTLGYPSSLDSVQAVAAIGSDGVRTGFSNWGTGLQFATPGTNVRSPDRQGSLGYNGSAGAAGDYTTFGGTSAASPFCAGVCALVWGAFPDWSPATILSLMRTTARDLGPAGYESGYGWGFPNANAALRFPGPNHMWCDEATLITGDTYNPANFSTGGANAVNDELQESCELNNVGVSRSVWYRYVPPCNGTLDINTIGSNYDTVLSVFRGNCLSATQVACDDDGGTGTTSQLTGVGVTAGFTYYIKVSAYGLNNAGGTLDFNFVYTPTPPNNDACGDATTILFSNYSTTRCTRGASTGLCEASTCGEGAGGAGRSVWWQFTPGVTGWADINTNGSSYDTTLSVWNGCPAAVIFNGQVICLGGNSIACDDDGGVGLQSLLNNVPLRKGVTYRIRAAAYGSANAGGDLSFNFSFSPCPADFNLSGSVSVQDIFDFLTAYFSADPTADINNSNSVTVQDIFDYLTLYFVANCG